MGGRHAATTQVLLRLPVLAAVPGPGRPSKRPAKSFVKGIFFLLGGTDDDQQRCGALQYIHSAHHPHDPPDYGSPRTPDRRPIRLVAAALPTTPVAHRDFKERGVMR